MGCSSKNGIFICFCLKREQKCLLMRNFFRIFAAVTNNNNLKFY